MGRSGRRRDVLSPHLGPKPVVSETYMAERGMATGLGHVTSSVIQYPLCNFYTGTRMIFLGQEAKRGGRKGLRS